MTCHNSKCISLPIHAFELKKRYSIAAYAYYRKDSCRRKVFTVLLTEETVQNMYQAMQNRAAENVKANWLAFCFYHRTKWHIPERLDWGFQKSLTIKVLAL